MAFFFHDTFFTKNINNAGEVNTWKKEQVDKYNMHTSFWEFP